jgi:hypothetical protein
MILSCRKRGPRALTVAGTVILVLAAAAAAAHAQAPKGRVSITGEVGGCLPVLDEVNKDIRLGNEALSRYGWSPMDEIHIGYTFTGDLRARVYGPITLSLGVGQSFAATGIDFDQVVSVKPRVSFYHFRVFYDLPIKPMPKMFLRVGGGPVSATSARVAVRHERRTSEGVVEWVESATFKAKGMGAHALIESELMLNQKTTLIIDLGYRMLNLDRSGNPRDFRDWKRSNVLNPEQESDIPGIPNLYHLAGVPEQGYLSAAFIEVDPRLTAPGTAGRQPLVGIRGMGKIDFSGPQISVGLRFYLF